MAQYGPYETELKVDINALNYDDFLRFIREIDQKMVACLGRK